MEIVHPKIEDYLISLLPTREAILREMEEMGDRRRFPIVGPLVGRVLEQLTRVTGASRIFEMGSGFGYSAFWFAKGLPPNGRVILTDGSAENIKQATGFFKRAHLDGKIEGVVGDALEIIDRYPGPFDIIFNDVDKEDYPKALKKAIPKLGKGGLFISDNALWFGSVLSKEDKPDVIGIQEFNRLSFMREDLYTTILPLRDGVAVSLKL